jgi:hypothetical protein
MNLRPACTLGGIVLPRGDKRPCLSAGKRGRLRPRFGEAPIPPSSARIIGNLSREAKLVAAPHSEFS